MWGYHWNRLESLKSVILAVNKPLLTEFDIHHKLEGSGFFQIKHLLLLHKNYRFLTRNIKSTAMMTRGSLADGTIGNL